MPSYDPQQVALFRYQLIAPLVSLSGSRGTLKREMERITASRLQLDNTQDRARLFHTVQAFQPRLLLLDPLVRLHRANENDAAEMAHVLSGLRELQKRFQVAVLVVHHTRKNGGAGGQPGQGLRGSSDLWAWSDSNLYLRCHQRQLLLSMEHRAAAAPDPVALRLLEADKKGAAS